MKCDSQSSESFCAYGHMLTCLHLLWRCCFSSLGGIFISLLKYLSITSQPRVTVTNVCQNLSNVFLYLLRQSIGLGILLVKRYTFVSRLKPICISSHLIMIYLYCWIWFVTFCQGFYVCVHKLLAHSDCLFSGTEVAVPIQSESGSMSTSSGFQSLWRAVTILLWTSAWIHKYHRIFVIG